MATEPERTEVLTPREWQVLELMRRGFADWQIAQVLGITETEAHSHATSVTRKLDLPSRDALIASPASASSAQQSASAQPSAGPAWRRSIPNAAKYALAGLAIVAGAVIAAIAVFLLADDNDRATAPVDEQGTVDIDISQPPLAGPDHWHADLDIWICGELQPHLPTFPGGVHTHNDGFIHIHPHSPSEQGSGAALAKFFEYGGGTLTQETLQRPGSDETYTEGDTCPDGTPATIKAWINGERTTGFVDYIPQDGDHIALAFGPPDEPEPGTGLPP